MSECKPLQVITATYRSEIQFLIAPPEERRKATLLAQYLLIRYTLESYLHKRIAEHANEGKVG